MSSSKAVPVRNSISARILMCQFVAFRPQEINSIHSEREHKELAVVFRRAYVLFVSSAEIDAGGALLCALD